MEAYTLYSGSAGNALLVRSGDTAVLVDAGRSRRAAATALSGVGMTPADIQAIFITHEHIDHTSALEQLAKRERIPIHAAAGTADAIACGTYVPAVLVRHAPQYTAHVGSLTVESFVLPHDSACHVGYRIYEAGGDAFCVATDMGHINDAVRHALPGCRGALLEANYDPGMLASGPYPPALQARIRSPYGHLSNGECASLASYAAMQGVTHIGLGHLSAENNTPACARRVVQAALGESVTLTVCARDTLTRIL